MPSNLNVDQATNISNKLKENLVKEIESLEYVAIQIKSHQVEISYFKPDIGKGFGWQKRGKFRGEEKDSSGQGPGGDCICPKCRYKTPHEAGVPCSQIICPKCKISLERKQYAKT